MTTYTVGVDFGFTPSRLVLRDETGRTWDMGDTVPEGRVVAIDGKPIGWDPDGDPVRPTNSIDITWNLNPAEMARLADMFGGLGRTVTVVAKTLGDNLREGIRGMALAVWELQHGPLKPRKAPVRAFKGKQVSMWVAWDGTRWRPVQRHSGYGWCYVDQWEIYQGKGR